MRHHLTAGHVPQPQRQSPLLPVRLIARMPYKENAPAEELLDLLPHRWIKAHPEAVIENLRDNIK